MKAFKITEPQAEYIAEIRLRNLNREYLLGRVNERDTLADEIKKLNEIFGSDEKIKSLISDQLRDVAKKYGAPRRTEIVYGEEAIAPVAAEELIEDYNVKLFLTEHGYFKKIPLVSLRSAADQYLKDDDRIVNESETSNRSEVLFFTNQCSVYKARVYDLPDAKASGLGEFLANLLGMDEGERPIYMTVANDYIGYVVFGFENGKAAKVTMDGYATKTNRKKLINAYSDKSKLISINRIETDCDFMLTRGTDKAMLVNSALISANSSKASSGMQVISLKRNTAMTSMRPLADTDMEPDEAEYYRADKIPSAGHYIVQGTL
jgi:DNA gyrase subunit A